MTRGARHNDTARSGAFVVVFVLAVLAPPLSHGQTSTSVAAPARPFDSAQGRELSVPEVKDFLKNARVIRQRGTPKGVTAPRRLTLSNGSIEHDAVFQAIDERKTVAELG